MFTTLKRHIVHVLLPYFLALEYIIEPALEYNPQLNKNSTNLENYFYVKLISSVRYTVPEIVNVNWIIKIIFDIIEREVKIIKCS